MQLISNTALITINETLVVQVLSFLIFMFIINRVMFRPLRKVMRTRDAHFEQIKQNIIQAEKDLVDYNDKVEKRRELAKNEAFESTKELEAQGYHEADEIIIAAQEEIFKLRQKTQGEIDRQIKQARQEIHKEVDTLATEIIEKVLERRLAS